MMTPSRQRLLIAARLGAQPQFSQDAPTRRPHSSHGLHAASQSAGYVPALTLPFVAITTYSVPFPDVVNGIPDVYGLTVTL